MTTETRGTLVAAPAPLSAAFADEVVRTGRSWWRAHYRSGKVLAEWETPPLLRRLAKIAVPGISTWRQTRWEDVQKAQMVGLELFCPNGRAGALRTDSLAGYRFVQWKIGGLALGLVQQGGGKRFVDAHVIGVVNDDLSGLFWSWEPDPHPFILNVELGRCLKCNLELGICPGSEVPASLRCTALSPDLTKTIRECGSTMPVGATCPDHGSRDLVWDQPGMFRHLFNFTDDVRKPMYRKQSPLSLDRQGVRV